MIGLEDSITARKMSVFENFLVPIFRIGIEYGVSLRIHSQCGKIRTSPNTDKFHLVRVCKTN